MSKNLISVTGVIKLLSQTMFISNVGLFFYFKLDVVSFSTLIQSELTLNHLFTRSNASTILVWKSFGLGTFTIILE